VGGRPVKTVARFRAYDSYAESFRDYAGMVSTSPRYAQARQHQGSVQGWTQGLQSGGYATDPDYAAKLSRAINTTLRVQRAQG
jgi:peptidoglycan hydrolase FlgJ